MGIEDFSGNCRSVHSDLIVRSTECSVERIWKGNAKGGLLVNAAVCDFSGNEAQVIEI